MKYWLIKSEPSTYSINDLKKDGRTSWNGVRNYQARNFMRDDMKKGDLVLFYHSNAEPPGVAGLCRIVKEGYLEEKSATKHDGFVHKALRTDSPTPCGEPAWVMVDVEFVEKFKRFVTLDELKADKKLQGMLVIKRGIRLSVQPVDNAHFDEAVRLGRGEADR